MKKIFILLAMLPLLFSCNIDGMIDDMIDDMMSLEPNLKNSIDYWVRDADQSSEEAKALVAFLVEKPAFAGKSGDNLQCQVVLNGDKWGGKPDKLGINYYIIGKLTLGSNQCTIKIDNYTYLNGTWSFTKETKRENDKDIEWIHLKNGSKSLSLQFHCEKD